MPMSVSEIIRLVKLRLEPLAAEEATQQAKQLVAAVLGIEPGAIIVHTWVEVTDEQIAIIGELLERRVSGEPLQYILGEWSFMGLPFYVDERALIPRQDTELLCETAVRLIGERGYQSVLDLCTGSGCIAVSIAKLTNAIVTAADISPEALSLAEENAALNEAQVTFIESNLFANISGKYDLITCNPPYLSHADMDQLQPEVAFEPKLALYGGEDGLDYYRRIAVAYRSHLNPGGALLLEIGSTQAQSVAELFDAEASVLQDLSGQSRVLVFET